MQLTNHPDLPDLNVFQQARDQWPDLLGMALRTEQVHYSVFMYDVFPAEVRAVELVIPGGLAFGSIAIGLALHFDAWSSHGGVFTQRFIALTFLLQQLGLSDLCSQAETSCECFHNGESLTEAARATHDGDFVSCWVLTRTLRADALCCCLSSSTCSQTLGQWA